jgi:organic hydroperoxide reductase OsmC/OhrA
MATSRHTYRTSLHWTGDRGTGTSSYRDYDRAHVVSSGDRPPIPGSSDPAFRGDPTRWSPEELLVASLSQCHMLWYLHLCAVAGVVVKGYEDEAEGVMVAGERGGRFERVVLRPVVTLADPAVEEQARALHADAHAACFIASSVSFPVEHEPVFRAAAA